MPPPPPPPPPANLPNKNVNNNNVQKLKKSKNEPKDVNALLSQIRQGTKLKKATQVNDRSAPIVAGSTTKNAADNQSERKSITPSMFKNGTNPLNLNFKLPSPLGGASTLSSSTLNRKSTSTVNNSNSSGLKSNQSSANSTISSKSNSSFNSSANNIAKSLTLRSPTKSLISEKSTAAASTKSDRPTTKPPPLPVKPPAVNRRQSFDSGQLSDISSTPMINKPPPPPRFATMKPQIPNQQLSTQTPNRQNRSISQNLSTLGGAPYSSSLNYSTMKLKTSTKNYPSNRPNLGAPPPPPIPKAPISTSSSHNQSSYNSQQQQQQQFNVVKPPPLPNIPLSPAPLPPVNQQKQYNPPLPPSLTSLTPSSAFVNQQPLHAAPVPPVRNNSSSNNCSKDLESRFHNQFTDINLLPAPDTFTNCKKVYSSAVAAGKSKLHRAPLPPNERTAPGFNPQLLNV